MFAGVLRYRGSKKFQDKINKSLGCSIDPEARRIGWSQETWNRFEICPTATIREDSEVIDARHAVADLIVMGIFKKQEIYIMGFSDAKNKQ